MGHRGQGDWFKEGEVHLDEPNDAGKFSFPSQGSVRNEGS